MDMHLRRTVDIQVRITCTDQMEQAKILYQDTIDIIFIKKGNFLFDIFHLCFMQHRIDGDIDSDISWMAVCDGFLKLFMGKVTRKGACRKARQSHIHSITSTRYGSLE